MIGCARVSGSCRITFSMKPTLFTANPGNSLGNWKSTIFFAKIWFPGPARPECARPYRTNAFSYVFVTFWSRRAGFPWIHNFLWKSWNCYKSLNMFDFYFSMEIIGFCIFRRTQNHKCFLRNIDDFADKSMRDALFSSETAKIITF